MAASAKSRCLMMSLIAMVCVQRRKYLTYIFLIGLLLAPFILFAQLTFKGKYQLSELRSDASVQTKQLRKILKTSATTKDSKINADTKQLPNNLTKSVTITNNKMNADNKLANEFTKSSPNKDKSANRKALASKMLIILSNMRSGSTLTADIMQQNPDVFYVFEPEYSVYHKELEHANLTLLNYKTKTALVVQSDLKLVESGCSSVGSVSACGAVGCQIDPSQLTLLQFGLLSVPTSGPQQVHQKPWAADTSCYFDIIRRFLTCDVYKLDMDTLSQRHMKCGSTTRSYNTCLFGKKSKSQIEKCLPILEYKCRSADVISLKTIRLPMTNIESLLTEFPQLKIIHLIRDPRATLNSQERLGFIKWDNLSDVATKLCSLISDNLMEARTILRKHPDRVYTLRYEDLAEEPVALSQEMYEFLDMNFTDDVKQYIRRITQSGRKDAGNYSTLRKNSTETAYKWRQSLIFERASIIDKICSDVYREMAYLPVPDKNSLVDMSFSLKMAKKFNI